MAIEGVTPAPANTDSIVTNTEVQQAPDDKTIVQRAGEAIQAYTVDLFKDPGLRAATSMIAPTLYRSILTRRPSAEPVVQDPFGGPWPEPQPENSPVAPAPDIPDSAESAYRPTRQPKNLLERIATHRHDSGLFEVEEIKEILKEENISTSDLASDVRVKVGNHTIRTDLLAKPGDPLPIVSVERPSINATVTSSIQKMPRAYFERMEAILEGIYKKSGKTAPPSEIIQAVVLGVSKHHEAFYRVFGHELSKNFSLLAEKILFDSLRILELGQMAEIPHFWGHAQLDTLVNALEHGAHSQGTEVQRINFQQLQDLEGRAQTHILAGDASSPRSVSVQNLVRELRQRSKACDFRDLYQRQFDITADGYKSATPGRVRSDIEIVIDDQVGSRYQRHITLKKLDDFSEKIEWLLTVRNPQLMVINFSDHGELTLLRDFPEAGFKIHLITNGTFSHHQLFFEYSLSSVQKLYELAGKKPPPPHIIEAVALGVLKNFASRDFVKPLGQKTAEVLLKETVHIIEAGRMAEIPEFWDGYKLQALTNILGEGLHTRTPALGIHNGQIVSKLIESSQAPRKSNPQIAGYIEDARELLASLKQEGNKVNPGVLHRASLAREVERAQRIATVSNEGSVAHLARPSLTAGSLALGIGIPALVLTGSVLDTLSVIRNPQASRSEIFFAKFETANAAAMLGLGAAEVFGSPGIRQASGRLLPIVGGGASIWTGGRRYSQGSRSGTISSAANLGWAGAQGGAGMVSIAGGFLLRRHPVGFAALEVGSAVVSYTADEFHQRTMGKGHAQNIANAVLVNNMTQIHFLLQEAYRDHLWCRYTVDCLFECLKNDATINSKDWRNNVSLQELVDACFDVLYENYTTLGPAWFGDPEACMLLFFGLHSTSPGRQQRAARAFYYETEPNSELAWAEFVKDYQLDPKKYGDLGKFYYRLADQAVKDELDAEAFARLVGVAWDPWTEKTTWEDPSPDPQEELRQMLKEGTPIPED